MDDYLTYFAFVTIAFFAGLVALRWVLLHFKKIKDGGAGPGQEIKILTAKPVDVKNRLVAVQWRGADYLIFVGSGSAVVVDKRAQAQSTTIQKAGGKP